METFSVAQSHITELMIDLNESITPAEAHADNILDLSGGAQEITLLGPTFTYLPEKLEFAVADEYKVGEEVKTGASGDWILVGKIVTNKVASAVLTIDPDLISPKLENG